MIKKNKKQKGITFIHLMILISVIGAIVIFVNVSISAIKEKKKISNVREIVSALKNQLEKNIKVDSRPNLIPPSDPINGGGLICDTYCTSTATWPSLAKTGYVYSVLPGNEISRGVSLFRIIKPINLSTPMDPNIINDLQKTAADFTTLTKDPIFSVFVEEGVVSMEEFQN